MQPTRGRRRTGTGKSWKSCYHGTCKTNNQTNTDENVFFFHFAQPCPIHRDNQIARILSRPEEVVAHAASECARCSKSLRWIGLCKRHEPKVKSLDSITKNTFICSKHFINPHPIDGPSEDHPDPLNANLSEEKVQKLKNSKRKKPSDRSAVVFQKKTRRRKKICEDTLPSSSQEADTPSQPQNVNSITENGNEGSVTLQIPCQEDDSRPSYLQNVKSIDGKCNSTSGPLLIPVLVNNIKNFSSQDSVIPVQERLCIPQKVNNSIEKSNSGTLLIPEQERVCSLPNVNRTNKISYSTSKSSLIFTQREIFLLPNVNSSAGNKNVTSETLSIPAQDTRYGPSNEQNTPSHEAVSDAPDQPQNVNSIEESVIETSETLLISPQDVSEPFIQRDVPVMENDDIFANPTYGSLVPETDDNLEALVTKYGKLNWFTNFNVESASFLKLSRDNLPLFFIKVTQDIEAFSYELFMFNQIFPVETAELDRIEEVKAKLKQMHEANVCKGVTCEELKKFFIEREMFAGASVCPITGGVRSHKCLLFSTKGEVCDSCTKYRYYLRHMLKRKSERKEPSKFASHNSMNEQMLRSKLATSASDLKAARKKISKYEKRIERLKTEKEELMKKNNNNRPNCDFASIFFEDSD